MTNAMLFYTVSEKKFPTFKLSTTLSNFNRFSNFLHCWKAYEICYKTAQHYPPHLTNVATLPWEIKNSNFLQIFSKQTAFLSFLTLLFIHKFWYIRCLRWQIFPYCLQIKFSVLLCSFTCLLLGSVCGTGNSSQQTSLQCLSTINMVFSDEDKILIKTHKRTQHTQLRTQRNWNRWTENAICLHFYISAEYLLKIWIFDFPR